jgi:hypothetical protein
MTKVQSSKLDENSNGAESQLSFKSALKNRSMSDIHIQSVGNGRNERNHDQYLFAFATKYLKPNLTLSVSVSETEN